MLAMELHAMTQVHLPQTREWRTVTRVAVTSNAFRDGNPIPHEYSAYGENRSPQLNWSDAGPECKSFVILCENPDGPRSRPFVHWMVVNLPPDYTALAASAPGHGAPLYMRGGIQGMNDCGGVGWFGPRPVAGHGRHHYHFKVYALNQKLDLSPGFCREDLERAMRGTIIGEGELVGTYERRP